MTSKLGGKQWKEVILVIPTKHAWLIHPYQFNSLLPRSVMTPTSAPPRNLALHPESCLCLNTSARLHGVACLNWGLNLGATHAPRPYLVFDTCTNQRVDSHQGEQELKGPPSSLPPLCLRRPERRLSASKRNLLSSHPFQAVCPGTVCGSYATPSIKIPI